MPRLARAVLAAWLSPLAFSLGVVFAASPANAQTAVLEGQAPPPPPSPTVVLDFSVPKGIDAVVGRKAADALAVELANSGNFTVKSRQQVEDAVKNLSGLTPPYNTATQANLARAVRARTVFSGRIINVNVTPGQTARVTIDVRQLEASTEDYINGTTISEISEVKLQNAPSEVLVDEAINKAAVSAVRSLRQTLLPRGTILNVNSDGIATLDIGSRNGVQTGQRYTLLRDIYNKAQDFTERVKIGEIKVTETEADQAYARLSAGGGSGMTTGDYVRRIYEFNNIPVTAAGNGATSQTPVTAPVSGSRAVGAGGRSRRGTLKRGVFGIAGLAAAIALFGFGGGGSGSSNNSPDDVTAYRNIPSDPARGPSNTNPFTGNITVTWTSGASGLQTEASNIAGYFVYRAQGGAPNTSDPNTLQGFVTGNTRIFSDNGTTQIKRQVTITAIGTPNDGGPSYQVTNAIVVNDDLPNLTPDTDTTTATLIQNLPLSGNSYFYTVQRVTVVEQTTTGTGTGTGGGTTTITRLLQLSNPSAPSGRVTAIAGPRVIPGNSNFNINGLQIAISGSSNVGTVTLPGATPLPTSTPDASGTPAPAQFVLPLYNEVTEFQIQVSADASFARGSYTAPIVAKPTTLDANGNFLLVLGQAISVPNYDPNSSTGNTPLYVRVGARNVADEPGRRTPFVFGPVTSFTPTGTGVATASTRGFLPNNGLSRGAEGVGIPGTSTGIRRRTGGGTGLSSVLRPR